MNDNKNQLAKKLNLHILAVICAVMGLCLTSYALIRVSKWIPDNTFQTGLIEINLNDGEPVFAEEDLLIEPGMSVTKNFFIINEGTWDVYYKIYLDEIQGDLADVLTVRIQNGEEILYEGIPSGLTRDHAMVSQHILGLGKRQDLTMTFCYPAQSIQKKQELSLSFKLCAEAVQTKNNPDKHFN